MAAEEVCCDHEQVDQGLHDEHLQQRLEVEQVEDHEVMESIQESHARHARDLEREELLEENHNLDHPMNGAMPPPRDDVLLSDDLNEHELHQETDGDASKKGNPFPSPVDGLVFAVNEDSFNRCSETTKTDSSVSGTSPDLTTPDDAGSLFEGRTEIHGTPSTEAPVGSSPNVEKRPACSARETEDISPASREHNSPTPNRKRVKLIQATGVLPPPPRRAKTNKPGGMPLPLGSSGADSSTTNVGGGDNINSCNSSEQGHANGSPNLDQGSSSVAGPNGIMGPPGSMSNPCSRRNSTMSKGGSSNNGGTCVNSIPVTGIAGSGTSSSNSSNPRGVLPLGGGSNPSSRSGGRGDGPSGMNSSSGNGSYAADRYVGSDRRGGPRGGPSDERWAQLMEQGKVGYNHPYGGGKGNRDQIEASPPWQKSSHMGGGRGGQYGSMNKGGGGYGGGYHHGGEGGYGGYGRMMGKGGYGGRMGMGGKGMNYHMDPDLHMGPGGHRGGKMGEYFRGMMHHPSDRRGHKGAGDFPMPPFAGPPGGNGSHPGDQHPGFGGGPPSGGPPGADILSSLMKGKPHLFGPLSGGPPGPGSGPPTTTWEAVSDLLNFNTDWMADYVTEYLNELEGGPAPRDLATMVRNSGPGVGAGGIRDEATLSSYSEKDWKAWLNDWASSDTPDEAQPSMPNPNLALLNNSNGTPGRKGGVSAVDATGLLESLLDPSVCAGPSGSSSTGSSSSTSSGGAGALLSGGSMIDDLWKSLDLGVPNPMSMSICPPPPRPDVMPPPPLSTAASTSASTAGGSNGPSRTTSTDYSFFNASKDQTASSNNADWTKYMENVLVGG